MNPLQRAFLKMNERIAVVIYSLVINVAMNATAALALDSAMTNRMKCDVHCLEGTRQGKTPIRLGARLWLMMRIVIVLFANDRDPCSECRRGPTSGWTAPPSKTWWGSCSHAAKM